MSGRRIGILVVLLLALCCVFGALGFMGYRYFIAPAAAAAVPVVEIDNPQQGDEVTVGEVVEIFATARDESGVRSVEVWIDVLTMLVRQESALPDGTNPFPLSAEWTPETEGNHTIVVRAENMAGETGQASISVNAVAGPDFPTEMPAEGCAGVPLIPYEVQEGETLEGIAAGHEVSVEDLLACNPGVADPLTAGQILYIPYIMTPEEEEQGGDPAEGPEIDEDPGGEEAPPPDTEPEGPPPDPEPPGPEPPPLPSPEPPPPPIVLEFEALRLQVSEDFLAVYCNVELQGNMERVPLDAHDFLAPIGLPEENYWDIGAEMGGTHAVPVAVQPGEFVELYVNCFGLFPADVTAYNLGEVARSHGDGDWHGNPIESPSTVGEALPEGGNGEFTVTYRICEGDCEDLPVPEPPTNLELHWCPVLEDYFIWSWTGTYPIEGFRLYRDGALLLEVPNPATTFVQVEAIDVQAPCEQDYEFTLTAYEGPLGVGAESAHSAPPVEVPGEFPCAQTAEVEFSVLATLCVPHDCPGSPPCDTCHVDVWYGSIHANEQRIVQEAPVCDPVMGTCAWGPPWANLPSYNCPFGPPCVAPSLAVVSRFGDDTLSVPMGAGDDLSIGVSLTDWDQHSADDFICDAEVVVPNASVVIGHSGVLICADPSEVRALVAWEITNVTP